MGCCRCVVIRHFGKKNEGILLYGTGFLYRTSFPDALSLTDPFVKTEVFGLVVVGVHLSVIITLEAVSKGASKSWNYTV